MTHASTHIALLRAVNVGGTGKLAMADLKAMCLEAGFANPRTYIASGNLVFESPLSQDDAKAELETRLTAYAGKPVTILMRTSEDLSVTAQNNPFPGEPGNKVVTVFLETAPETNDLNEIRHQTSEVIRPSGREIYIHFPDGQGNSRLTFPALREGTARNMNTVEKLVKMSKD